MRLLGLPPALAADEAVRAAFSDRATVQAALDFEAALARAEATCGVIPAAAVAPITAACQAELYDLDALAVGALRAGTLAIPLVKRLGEEVARHDTAAAGWVHFGATSQDVLDTALVLQLRRAVPLLLSQAEAVVSPLRGLAREHRDTPMLGRTLLQPGPPITFGLKAAGWLGGVARGAARLRQAADEALLLQFGGAVGTLSALGDKGPEVARALGAALGLPVPEAPWHAHRDRLASFACAAAVLAGSAGKIARDITLLMQAEIAEAQEPGGQGRGGSSTMPHKRNPVASVVALAANQRVPGLLASIVGGLPGEHERAAGAWQAEAAAHAELVLALSAALSAMAEALGGLRVDPAAMRANLERLRGLVMAEPLALALAPSLGRGQAHELVERLVGEVAGTGRHLREVAGDDAEVRHVLDAAALDRVFDPADYLGSAGSFTDALLATATDGE
jgi:3-carboxy-cis,cis-muconate cycloisomerase